MSSPDIKKHREAIKAIINSTQETVSSEQTVKWGNERGKILSAIKQGKYQDAFVSLQIMRDMRHGITTKFDQYDGGPVLVRNARNQSTVSNLAAKTCFSQLATIGINFVSGISSLVESYKNQAVTIAYNESDINSKNDDLIGKTEKFYLRLEATEKISNDQGEREKLANEELSRFYHNTLIPHVINMRTILTGKNISKKQAMNELRIARDFATMKQTPYMIATLSAMDGHPKTSMIELETPLTNNLEDEYTGDLAKKGWYNALDPVTKGLVKIYSEKLGKRDCMIPSQLFHLIPGMRNTFEKVTAIHDGKTVSILNTKIHSGTPGHKFTDKNASQEATNNTVKQMKKASGAEVLFINTLLTPGHSKKDKRLVKEIRIAVMRNEAVHVINTPINGMRFRQALDISGFKTLIAHALVELQKPFQQSTVKYAKHLSSRIKQLQEHLNQRPKNFFSRLFFDKEHSNLQIAVSANLLITAMNNAAGKNKYAIIDGCASGQDRGGLVSMHTTVMALFNHLKDAPNINQNHLLNDIVEKISKAAHSPVMAGSYGTGWGFGIKFRAKMFPSVYSRWLGFLTTNQKPIFNGIKGFFAWLMGAPTAKQFSGATAEANEKNPEPARNISPTDDKKIQKIILPPAGESQGIKPTLTQRKQAETHVSNNPHGLFPKKGTDNSWTRNHTPSTKNDSSQAMPARQH